MQLKPFNFLKACSCYTIGTNGNEGCDKVTGSCECKLHVTGRACDKCKVNLFDKNLRWNPSKTISHFNNHLFYSSLNISVWVRMTRTAASHAIVTWAVRTTTSAIRWADSASASRTWAAVRATSPTTATTVPLWIICSTKPRTPLESIK